MSLWRNIVQIVRSLPDAFIAWSARVVMRAHQPDDVDGDGDGKTAVCLRCQQTWPCDLFIDAAARLDAHPPQTNPEGTQR